MTNSWPGLISDPRSLANEATSIPFRDGWNRCEESIPPIPGPDRKLDRTENFRGTLFRLSILDTVNLFPPINVIYTLQENLAINFQILQNKK